MNLQQFLASFNTEMEKQSKELSEVSWLAQTTGDAQWSEKLGDLGTKYSLLFSNKDAYDQAQRFYASNEATEIEQRQLFSLIQAMKGNQLPETLLADLSKRDADLNLLFNTYIPEVNGKTYSANEIRHILINSNDLALRQEAWEASKQVGEVVVSDLLTLIKKRNEAAQLLGYSDYHEAGYDLQELDREEVFSIFNNLIEQSDKAYRALKLELDTQLAERFEIQVEDIRPWHYADPFFQEAPATNATNLDAFYKGKDLLQLTTDTFEALRISIDDLYEKSDLYPREKKNPTAFCTDIDRNGDVRVLCNLEEDAYWMETNLHEFGHAAYFKYVNPEFPFILREPSHTLTTESIAMLFGKMGKDPRWLKKILQLDSTEVDALTPDLTKFQQLQMLIQARWMITFSFFERELYANPDQDLNALWWSLVEKIQLVTPPENRHTADWAAKIHFTLAPIYYQNYLLGELMAAQLLRHIETTISPEFFTKETGDLLLEQFFKPAALYNWNEKIKRVTGETLNPSYFVDVYCTSN